MNLLSCLSKLPEKVLAGRSRGEPGRLSMHITIPVIASSRPTDQHLVELVGVAPTCSRFVAWQISSAPCEGPSEK